MSTREVETDSAFVAFRALTCADGLSSDNPPRAQACVLVAPAVWGWSVLPVAYRVALWAAMYTLPSWGLTGAGWRIRSTDNEDVARAYGRDPLFHKSARTDAIYRLVELMARGARASTHLGMLPVLLLYGGNDQIIPRVATEVFSSLLGKNATVKFYPDGFHMLLRDHAGAARAADIAEWIDAISCDRPPVRSNPPSEHKAENNDQDGAEDSDAAVTEAVSVAAEASTKTADQ